MKHLVIKDSLDLNAFSDDLVACIGYFDGLHTGHQHLFKEVFAISQSNNLKSAMITFEPDPWSVIHQNHRIHHLTPTKTKIELAATLGFDYFVTINFTPQLMKLSPIEFIERILVTLKVRTLVVGEDFKFGYQGLGDVATLRTQGQHFFDTIVVPIDPNAPKVGTTAIVQSLLRGDITLVNEMLGRPYMLAGVVVHGNKQGRLIGFPTANLDIIDEYVIPPTGVYAGYVVIDDVRFLTATSVGYNLTFNTQQSVKVEVHILGYEGDLYGKWMKHYFLDRIRGEIKFDTVDQLIVQIQKDVDQVFESYGDLLSVAP